MNTRNHLPEKQYEHVAVHGRFQPPVHKHHWRYICSGFELGEKVTVYLTNPFNNETAVDTASWRSLPSSNPFTFAERKDMMMRIFEKAGLESQVVGIEPLDIRDPDAIDQLPDDITQVVNIYSPWSAQKARTFESHGKQTVRLALDEENTGISGTAVRRDLRDLLTDERFKSFDQDLEAQRYIFDVRASQVGIIPEAIPGLWEYRDGLLR